MNRQKIRELVVEALREIQEASGLEVPNEFTDEMRPIGDLDGFDSLNAIEFGAILSKTIHLEPDLNPCVSEDGKKALAIREIVDRLEALVASEGGDADE